MQTPAQSTNSLQSSTVSLLPKGLPADTPVSVRPCCCNQNNPNGCEWHIFHPGRQILAVHHEKTSDEPVQSQYSPPNSPSNNPLTEGPAQFVRVRIPRRCDVHPQAKLLEAKRLRSVGAGARRKNPVLGLQRRHRSGKLDRTSGNLSRYRNASRRCHSGRLGEGGSGGGRLLLAPPAFSLCFSDRIMVPFQFVLGSTLFAGLWCLYQN